MWAAYMLFVALLCFAPSSLAQTTKGFNFRTKQKIDERYQDPPQPREFPRRRFELAAEAGAIFPEYEAFGPGLTSSVAAFWRGSWTGLGLRGGYVFQPARPFPVQVSATEQVTRTGPSAHVPFIVITPRLSIPVWEQFEPWVEPFSVYAWPLGAFEAAVGADFYVTRDLRLGLAVRYGLFPPYTKKLVFYFNRDPDPFQKNTLGPSLALRAAWGVGTEVH